MLQVVLAAVLSVAYGANTGQTTMGNVAMMHVITKSQAVPETATPGIVLHAIKTAAMLFGAISWGARLAPVTGMPCRRKEKKSKEKKRKEKKREEKRRKEKRKKKKQRRGEGKKRKRKKKLRLSASI